MAEDDEAAKARLFRERALQLRQQAREVKGLYARETFLRLADGYDQMAARIESPYPRK